jgi:hypothetical protein
MSVIDLSLPIRTRNPLNGQTGNSRRAAAIRTKQRAHVRGIVRLAVSAALRSSGLRLPCSVRLTRVSAGKLDPWDGLPAALKAVVDGVSDAFGVRDDDPRLQWEKPEQRQCNRGTYGVDVRIEPKSEDESVLPKHIS